MAIPICRSIALLALGLLCLFCTASAQQYKRFKDVPGIQKTEEGQYFLEHGGITYGVFRDEEKGGVFFANEAAGMAQWHDPRGPGPFKLLMLSCTAVQAVRRAAVCGPPHGCAACVCWMLLLWGVCVALRLGSGGSRTTSAAA